MGEEERSQEMGGGGSKEFSFFTGRLSEQSSILIFFVRGCEDIGDGYKVTETELGNLFPPESGEQ